MFCYMKNILYLCSKFQNYIVMKHLFCITETVELPFEVYVEAESWAEARKLYSDGIDIEKWEQCPPGLAKIELTLLDGNDIDYRLMDVVATLELTGFQEDDKAIEELDKKLKEA